jgi:hypothetical protein
VATTGQAMQKGIGWRDGLSPKARRELLGHSQLSLAP